MKKIISIILCFIMTLPLALSMGCAKNPGGGGGGAEYTPITRFVVTSDVHLRNNGAKESLERLEAVFDTAYGYAENHTTYTGLDGIYFLGDFTDSGSENQQKLFFSTVEEKTKGDTLVRAVMGNHEYVNTGYFKDDSLTQAPTNYLEWSGYEEADVHFEVDGYHVIMVSEDRYPPQTGDANVFYTQEKIDWLKDELDAAVEADTTGKKPIFVMGHIGAMGTVLGAETRNGDAKLRELLNNYPNVVNFSGHSHRPVVDPRSIWQGEFTALQTGSLCYLSLMIVGHPDYNSSGIRETEDGGWEVSGTEHGVRNGNMYYMCEIDKNNVMRIYTYDAINDEVFGEPYILDSFDDPTKFDYTSARQETSEAPKFKTDDQITVVSNNYHEVEITYPQATCKDVVQNYRVDVYLGNKLTKSEYSISLFHLGNSMPDTIKTKITGLLPSVNYTLKVVPVSCWGKEGAPLTTEITTSVKDAGEEFILLDADTADAATALRQCKGSSWNSTKATRVENADLPILGYSGAAMKMSVGSKYDIYATLNYGKTEIEALVNAYGYEQVVITYLLVKGEDTQSTFTAAALPSNKANEWVSEIISVERLLDNLGKNVNATNAPADNVLLLASWWKSGDLHIYLGDISFIEPTVQ